MVIIKEDNLHPCNWKLGLVEDLHIGTDGLPRVVSVRCSNGTIKRPITKLCLLPVDPDGTV